MNFSIDFEPVPKKRGKVKTCITIGLFITTFTLVTALGLHDKEEDVYQRDTAQKNTTNYCYRPKKEKMFSSIFIVTLNFFGVIVGALADRLSFLPEEAHHVRERYDGSKCKMLKACFSVIEWGAIAVTLMLNVLLFLIITSYTEIHRPLFEVRYLVYIFSGFGVSPLIQQFLHLDKHCKVYISTLLEKNEWYAATELAPAYWDEIKKKVNEFNRVIEHADLTLNKLLLLIPLDCNITDDLHNFDDKFVKLSEDEDPFPIYSLTVNEREQNKFAIQFVQKPLEFLQYIKSITKNKVAGSLTCVEEVKLFYRKLSEILEEEKQDKFVLVPICTAFLQNGGLVKCIMEVVNRPDHRVPGFMKLVRVDDQSVVIRRHELHPAQRIDLPLLPRVREVLEEQPLMQETSL